MSLEIDKRGVSELTTDAVPDKTKDSIKTNSEPNLCDNNDNEDAKRDITSEASEPQLLEPKTTTESNAEPTSTPNQQNASKPKKKTKRNKDVTARFHPQVATIYNISRSNGIHIGNSTVIQCNSGSNSPQKSPMTEGKELTKEIKNLLKSMEPITLDDVALVSSHVGSNWMDVGRHLKYTNGQLEQFHEDNGRKGLKEVVYQLLLDWKQVNTSRATVGFLCTALWVSKQYDAVEVLTKKPNIGGNQI